MINSNWDIDGIGQDSPYALVHRDFLLMRDYTGLAVLFVVVFGATALIVVPSWRVALAYCLLLVAQFVLTRQAAATYGARFVTTVLAQKARD
jgi:hypothetical protein